MMQVHRRDRQLGAGVPIIYRLLALGIIGVLLGLGARWLQGPG